jgi:hypothetical protein
MDLYAGQNLLDFTVWFKTDENCKEYLANFKWENGFECVKCHHTASQIRKDFSRTCNKCSHTKTESSNILFNKVKFGLCKAFFMCFEKVTNTKSLSVSYIGVRFGVTEKTARLFMHKNLRSY